MSVSPTPAPSHVVTLLAKSLLRHVEQSAATLRRRTTGMTTQSVTQSKEAI
jgi:hypothetical protein